MTAAAVNRLGEDLHSGTAPDLLTPPVLATGSEERRNKYSNSKTASPNQIYGDLASWAHIAEL